MSTEDPLFGEIIAIYSEHYKKLKNALCERDVEFRMLKKLVLILTTVC
jgi:hypothetical protein